MAFFPNVKIGQYFNFFLVIILSFLIFTFLKTKYKDYQYGLLGLTFSLSIPVVIYSLPQINNEVLLTFLVDIGLIFYYFNQKILNHKNSVIIGLIAGLCLLTKYSGIVYLIAVILDIYLKRFKLSLKAFKPIVIILVTTFVLSGWIYIRNFLIYRNPFVSNIDLFHTEQIPSSRDISFLTNISAFFNGDYYNSRYYSLWGGIYYSFFHDEHNAIIPSTHIGKTDSSLTTRPIGILFLIIAGLIYTVVKKKNDQVFTIYFLLVIITFIYYCYKYPTSTSVKGIYLLSTILPLCVFGLNLIRKYKINIYFIYGYLLLYSWVVIQNFWMLSSWL